MKITLKTVNKKKEVEITSEDREEIGRQVKKGFTSGTLDRDGNRIIWSLSAQKFQY